MATIDENGLYLRVRASKYRGRNDRAKIHKKSLELSRRIRKRSKNASLVVTLFLIAQTAERFGINFF